MKRQRSRHPLLHALAPTACVGLILAGGAIGEAAIATKPPQVAALAAARPARVLTCTGHAVARPAQYILAYADYNAYWTRAKWVHSGGRTTSGKGTLVENNCIPDCASGHFVSYPVKLLLWHVRNTKKYGPLYSKVTLSLIEVGDPSGEPQVIDVAPGRVKVIWRAKGAQIS